RADLGQLRNPWLRITMTPIGRPGGGYYDTQLNAVVNLSWRDHSTPRSVEIPLVFGVGDVTHTRRDSFSSPAPVPTIVVTSPTPTPTPTPTSGGTPTPTPAPTASSACVGVGTLPAGTVCISNSTCPTTCCSG